jgi:hypothetical protein
MERGAAGLETNGQNRPAAAKKSELARRGYKKKWPLERTATRVSGDLSSRL